MDAINAVVLGLEYEDVDTAAEVQALADGLSVDITAPTFTSASTKEVAENQTDAITLVATDTTTVTYSISGDDASSFTVDSSSGVVRFLVAPDYETKSSYSFTATATDTSANSSTQDVTISITNIADVVPILSATLLDINEDKAVGTVVGNIVVSNSGMLLSRDIH